MVRANEKKSTSFLLFFSIWFVSSNYIVCTISVTEEEAEASDSQFSLQEDPITP